MSLAIVDRLFEPDHNDNETPPWALSFRGLCFFVIVALHAGVAWFILTLQPPEEGAPAAAPSVVMIDLAPLPVAPPEPVAEIPVETPPAPMREVAEPPPPEPEPVVEPIIPPPPPAPAPKVEVAVPVEPKPVVKPPKPPQPVVRREPPKPRPDVTPPAQATTAPPRVDAPPAPAAAAPAPGAVAPASNAMPTWQGALMRRLEQAKRYPSTAQFQHQEGVVQLRFTMNRQGKVLSAQIAKSSGFSALDEETLALIRRAEPLPVPPPNLPGETIGLVVPIQFSLHR